MNVKKWVLGVTLVCSMGLILAGCSNSGSTGTSAKAKTLEVITYANWNPFEYKDKGEVVGFDIDLIKAIAKDAGMEVKITDSGWDPMFAKIKGKTADAAISGITITDSRKQTYDFSNPYFASSQSIVVKEGSDIKNANDLKNNKTIAVQNGSTGQEAVEKLIGKNNEHIKLISSGLTYMELMRGSTDAVVGDDTSNKAFLKENPNSGLVIVTDKTNFAPEYFGIMFPQGSELKTVFDKSLKNIIDNGTYAEIYKKWFKVDPDMAEIKAVQK